MIAAQSGAVREKSHARQRRQVWESVGLVPDELSSSTLVMNLAAVGTSLTDEILRNHHAAGMPCRLTFRHLRLHPSQFDPSSVRGDESVTLFVCENPGVLAAAAEALGSRCPPMLCVEGQPNLTCLSLLALLRKAGMKIKYHGDFDWGGLRIANQVYRTAPFEPWRFSAVDHRVVSGNHRKLRPPVADAVWDTELASAILACGVAVEEESVIDELLGDLKEIAFSI